MRGRGPVKCDPNRINKEIRIRRGGSSSSGSGPSGWKLKPAKQLSRSLAEMAIKYKKVKK